MKILLFLSLLEIEFVQNDGTFLKRSNLRKRVSIETVLF